MWIQTCLVNLSGEQGRCLTEDKFNELIVHRIKEDMEVSSNAFISDYLENVLSWQIMIALRARRAMYDALNTVNYGQRSSKANTQNHVTMHQENGKVHRDHLASQVVRVDDQGGRNVKLQHWVTSGVQKCTR